MKNANPLDIELLASFNQYLQQIWSNRNVQETWELLDKGIEEISNMVAPTKVVQHKSNFQPYLTDKLRELNNSVKTKFSQAVATGRDYDWAEHNLAKSIYQKSLNLAKNQYFTSTLTGARNI